MDSIKIINLEKSFSKSKALKGINLSVSKGEIFGYLGPNGAGKTTTISCMLDLIRSDSGKILINELDSRRDSNEIKKAIGFVPSDPYFYPNWTGQDHLEYIEKIKGKSSLKRQIINDFDFNQKNKIHSLSTGNKQKLSLIIALMHQPNILILDEPTRGLDPLLQNVLYEYIRTFNKNGCTIFMSSHNLTEVENICSRVAIIKSGEVIEVADVKTLQNKSIFLVSTDYTKPVNFNSKSLSAKGIEIKKKHSNNQYEFNVTGDINEALKIITEKELNDIKISKASLEETFLKFYK